MTRVMNLSEDILTQPQRLHVGQIETAMLWPDDPQMRKQALQTMLVEEFRQHIGTMSPEILAVYALKASNAKAIEDIQSQARERVFDGLIAGRLLHEFVGCGGCRPMGEIRQEICDKLRGTKQLQPRTIENKIWPRFKEVAHFWAAHFGHATASHDVTFPCRTSRVLEFLSDAEFYRRKGEQLKAHRSPRTALLNGQAILLPPVIEAALPRREIQFTEVIPKS